MIILTIRTDKPEAEIGLYNSDSQLGYRTWHAHRQLAETIHQTIDDVCKEHGYTTHDIQGIVCFKGPGSFTGLRIGLTVGNALAYALQIPIVATSGDTWRDEGIQQLGAGVNESVVAPEYDAPATTTAPKK